MIDGQQELLALGDRHRFEGLLEPVPAGRVAAAQHLRQAGPGRLRQGQRDDPEPALLMRRHRVQRPVLVGLPAVLSDPEAL